MATKNRDVIQIPNNGCNTPLNKVSSPTPAQKLIKTIRETSNSADDIKFLYLLSTGFMNSKQMIFHPITPAINPNNEPDISSIKRFCFVINIEVKVEPEV